MSTAGARTPNRSSSAMRRAGHNAILACERVRLESRTHGGLS